MEAGTTIELWPDASKNSQGENNQGCPSLTLYPAVGDGLRAAVIICPGGGYWGRAPHEGEPIAKWLNGLGISAYVLNYRVAPYKHPIPLQDAQRAIRTVRFHAEAWGIDANRIGILGFSAGGHLAATAGTHYDAGDANAQDLIDQMSSRPNLMVLCYPVISFGIYTHQGSRINLIGETPDDDLVQHLSNELHVTGDTPPTFLWHTADDEAVVVENSLLFASALSRHKVPFDLHVFESGVHGIGIADDHAEAYLWPEACANWLKKQRFA
ncbi:alpha/beta hydrolase [Paenibacillus roseipurpureus]|uniref:Alpha/beta hydrolase n=1 Tax=Paenibacillus roseopurpureus TaxID=2918901 RepID=A0AA96LRY1_9BACL|nr:alpha/beta hydrolase [Paenibacillus sp. MBLB1832]WNR43630.1 alpha/beta hydrolase [Paenibacillus sp. MBLB1832]